MSEHQAAAPDPAALPYAIVIHGGAGSAPEAMRREDRVEREQTLRTTLRKATAHLAEGGTSLDAVEQVIRTLEDHPLFNAGRGSVLDARGEVEMDASIMDGSTKACGAVAAVSTIKNPITLARRVMTETPHVLLVGDGAEAFAREQGLPVATLDDLRTEAQLRRWKAARGDNVHDPSHPPDDGLLATVGCVALDNDGNLAAGTSTGGLAMKQYGRVGDSPIIGAGTYADNATCGVSCTGIGEQFIRHVVACDVAARLRYTRTSLEVAVHTILHRRLDPGDGGIIAIDRRGRLTAQFTTGGMPRAWADATGTFEVALGVRE